MESLKQGVCLQQSQKKKKKPKLANILTVGFAYNDLAISHNIRMIESKKTGNLTQGGHGKTRAILLKLDFFHGDNVR